MALAGLLAWCVLQSAPAHAQPPVLSWNAPAECPTASQVEQRIASLLSAQPEARTQPAVRASGLLTHARSGYKLVLTVQSAETRGSRTLRGDDCAALSETAAWLVAVTIDPNVPEVGQPPTVEPAAPPEPLAEPAVPVPAKPTPAPVAKPAPQPLPSLWSLHAAGFGGVWGADRPRRPRAQLGGSLGVGYRYLDGELRYAYALPRNHALGRGQAASATHSFSAASCVMLGVRLRAGPCAGFSLLLTHAESRNIVTPRERTALWYALTVSAQVSLEIVRHFELFAEGGLNAALARRPRFELRDVGQGNAFSTARGFGYGRIGLRVRWSVPRAGVP